MADNVTRTNQKTTWDADTNSDTVVRTIDKNGKQAQVFVQDWGGADAEDLAVPEFATTTKQDAIIAAIGTIPGAGSASAATRTQVADSATAVQLLAANANRLYAKIFNDSTALLYLGLGDTEVTATNYTTKVYTNSGFDVPPQFKGQVRGIWATDPGDGGAKVTEI